MMRPVGNDNLIEKLAHEIQCGTLSHAYLISAPNGGGKSVFGAYFAKMALCMRQGGEPCESCNSCAMINAGGHPDMKVITPSGDKVKSIKVDDIRDIMSTCFVKPVAAPRRVFIIDDADKMTAEAQNALLKILEEPPSNVLFVLLAESVQKLLPTVRSRCVIIKLALLDKECVSSLLTDRGAKIEKEAAAAYSGGVAGEAMFVSTATGSEVYDAGAEFVLKLCTTDMYGFLRLSGKISKNRETEVACMDAALKFLSDVCRCKGAKQDDWYYEGRRESVLDAANKLTKVQLTNIINILQNLKTDAESGALDLRLATVSAMLSCWEEVH